MNKFDITKYETIALKATEKAAIECYPWIGKNDNEAADLAATDAIRNYLNQQNIRAEVVIGEGERDEAPMLFIGELLGKADHLDIDIAVDPLEGTSLCSKNKKGALSVIAMAPKNTILKAPDIYMEKFAVGLNIGPEVIDLDNTIKQNLSNLAKVKKCQISDLKIMILDRPRHEKLISDVKQIGANVILFDDGDIAAIISTIYGQKQIDAYIGIGGAPEGVLAAAAMKSLGGYMMTRLVFNHQDDKTRAISYGISDLNKKYLISDMILDDVTFSATAITDSHILKGVYCQNNIFYTQSLLITSHNPLKIIQSKHHIS